MTVTIKPPKPSLLSYVPNEKITDKHIITAYHPKEGISFVESNQEIKAPGVLSKLRASLYGFAPKIFSSFQEQHQTIIRYKEQEENKKKMPEIVSQIKNTYVSHVRISKGNDISLKVEGMLSGVSQKPLTDRDLLAWNETTLQMEKTRGKYYEVLLKKVNIFLSDKKINEEAYGDNVAKFLRNTMLVFLREQDDYLDLSDEKGIDIFINRVFDEKIQSV